MAKQLNVNLAMTADTSKAKAELQSLQNTLNQLMMSTSKKDMSLGLTSEIQKATQMAAQLKVQLENATTSTGRLDLTKFNQGLQKSGLQLKDYRTALSALGPEGTQAFSQLASSIMSAEVPLRRSNTLLTNFATTLKNTARWQISSSILHGFMGALQGAYGYAQDLNESLNNIRIVTGQNIDQMAKFADQANKAAKNLSTTTTAYTDAALIYYQQGLKDKEVIDRTDVTVKMANVSRQSAEEVSSQMTAIWNNFADGSKELEYYADVITALGAATASSSDEIAEGLQKFAAIADTVGLSYEKATAALATVVAETRQSADVVGTAFKTMFARLQGLSLGETLEDGVDLNKYSSALKTVGVDIIDAKGNLKDMDSILDETAEKWNTISEAQKVALAETVAGVRQYSQFMAIMENYDKILANQDLAAGSSGTLQEQADIYAESWEAAQKRVKAAMQGIYDDLLDDKFFIKILNGVEKVISFFDKLIDNIGGLKGVLLTLGSVLTTVFSAQIQTSINNIVAGIQNMTPAGQKAAQSLRQKANEELMTIAGQTGDTATGRAMETAYSSQANLQGTLLKNAKFLTQEQQKQAQLLLDMNRQMGEEAIAAGKAADEQQRLTEELETQLAINTKKINDKANKDASGYERTAEDKALVMELINSSKQSLEEARTALVKTQNAANVLGEATKTIPQNLASSATEAENFQQKLNSAAKIITESFSTKNIDFSKIQLDKIVNIDGKDIKDIKELAQAISDLEVELSSGELSADRLIEINQALKQASNIFKEVSSSSKETGVIGNAIEQVAIAEAELEEAYSLTTMDQAAASQATDKLSQAYEKNAQAAENAANQNANLENAEKSTNDALNAMTNNQITFGQVMTDFASTAMSVASAINAIKSIGNIWSNDDLSTGEKLLQTMMSLGMILPLISNMTKLQTTLNGLFAKSQVAAGVSGEAMAAGEMAAAGGAQALQLALWQVYLIVAALVGVIWLLVKGFEAIKASTPEGKLEAAKDRAEELKTALDEATTAANDLKSAFDSYKSVREKLESCTKGTEEWYEALNEVNDQVLDLLAKYPELAEYLHTDANGAMYFDAEGMAKVQQAYNNEALAARGASIGADAAVREAQINVDKNNLIKTLSQNSSGPGFNGGGGENVSAMSKLIAENAESLKGLSGDQLTSAIGKILDSGGFSTKLAQSFADTIENNGLIDSIIDLNNSIQENSAATQAANQAMAASILANNDQVNDSQYLSDISNIAGNIYGQQYDKFYDFYRAEGLDEVTAANWAAVDAINAVNVAAVDLVQKFGELATSGDAADHALKDFLTSGNLEGASQSDFQSLYSELGFDNYSKQTGQSRDEYQKIHIQDYLNEALGGSDGIFDDIDAQEYGATTAEEFIAAFQQKINDANIMWNSLSPEDAAEKDEENLKAKLAAAAEQHAVAAELETDRVQLLTEAFAEETELLGGVADSQDELAEAAADAATRFNRLNDAVDDIADNYEDYSDILNKVANAQNAQDKAMAMSDKSFKNLRKSLAGVLDVNEDLVSNDFLSKLDPSILNDLAEGGETATEAVKKLRESFIDAQAAEADLANDPDFDDFKSKLAELEDGAVLDIDNYPFLEKLIQSKLAAGASAEEIEQMLSGMGIDCDVTPFEGAMADLEAAAAEAAASAQESGDAIVGAMSTNAETNTVTAENTDVQEDTAFQETITPTTLYVTDKVLEGPNSTLKNVTQQITAFRKTVDPIPVREEETKEKTVTAVKLSNMHKSAGGNVSSNSGRSGGHGGGGSCFVAGTLVSLKDYYKKIEEIQPGDIVLSYNEQTMKNEYSKVLQTMIHNTTEEFYSLFIENEELQATGVHRFLITRNNKQEWIMASNLIKGDLVLFADGTLHEISKIKIKIQTLTVYNFEVSNNHNYYVSKSQILAHNKGGGGGGGGKAATTKAATHKHEVHRYNNEENAVKGLSNIYDRLETAKSKAFGADRIRIMERELAMLKKLKDASADYLGAVVGSGNVDKVVRAVYSGKDVGSMIATGEFGGTIADDYRALFSGKSASGKNLEYNYKDEAGNERLLETEYTLAGLNKALGSNISVGLDSYGNINNKDKLLYDLDELYNQEMNRWSKIAEPTAAQENEHNRNLAYIEEFKERLEQFDETAQLIQEKVDAYLDYIYQAQALNAEKIVHELEVNNTLTEHQLEEIQNAIKLLGNKIYRSTEAMNEWFRKNFKERQDAYAQNVSKAQSSVEEAMSKWQLWAADELNPEGIDSASALDIIEQAKDQVQAAFDDIFDQIDEMRSFFGDTLDYWNERIQSITDAMEANVDTLDHLQNVLSLLGKATDYKALGVIIKGALDVAKDNYLAAKAKSEASSSLYNQAMRDYASLSGENAEFFYESTVMPAREQMLEDQANMQAALENVLEKVNAWFENELNRIYQESEDRLVDKWGSFDALDSAMERQKNLADEYLTKTNQLYETNTLLRKLSQDIDKTDSQIAKAKLKAFSDEIEAMKEQNQLSKTDLEIAKARYELLQAQIALEEAQNAKSVVRLQRDNEGNYGYVYTADQDKVNDAEQNFADKQNDLYNLVLSQTQDYTEKIIQTTEERNAALRDLDEQWLNGEITDYDEYLTLRNDITEKYNDLLKAEYESYYTAVRWLNEVGAEGQTEAWTNSFSDILYAQDDFAAEIQAETDRIVTETDEQMNWLNDQRAYYTNEAKVGNKELKDSVDDITNANKLLTNSLTGPGGLISGMSSAATAAERLTREFASQYEALLDVAAGYAQVISEMNAYYATIAAYERSDDSGNDSGINLDTNYDSALQEAVKRGLISGTDDELFQTGNANREKKINALGLTQDYYGEKGSQFVSDFSSNLGNYKSGKLDYDIYGNLSDEELLRKLAGFATGGYTGRWGESGKLALLHEKELVLNDKDTSNILNAVTLIRQISSAIDLRAAASSLSSGLKSPFYNNENGMLEQIVTIHAEFPNVQSHNEIEEAFDDLINRASQFANRR